MRAFSINEIRKIRESAGIQQKEFAELMGMPKSTWGSYERRLNTTPRMVLMKATEILLDLGCLTDMEKEMLNRGYKESAPTIEEDKTEEGTNEDIVDHVNHPPHYANRKFEVIDVMKDTLTTEGYRGYLEGNVIKYVMRFKYKGSDKQDLQKANWYLTKLIEEYNNLGEEN